MGIQNLGLPLESERENIEHAFAFSSFLTPQIRTHILYLYKTKNYRLIFLLPDLFYVKHFNSIASQSQLI